MTGTPDYDKALPVGAIPAAGGRLGPDRHGVWRADRGRS